MAHDVFISYSSIDKPVADAVCASIESSQIRCWIAPRDVLPSSSYGEAIIEAINGSRVVVLVFSSASNASSQVMREIERAVSKEVPIIPFRIAEVTPTKSMEYFLSAPHWLDAMTPPLEAHLNRLVDVVHSIVALGASADEHSETPKVVRNFTHEGNPNGKKTIPQQKSLFVKKMRLRWRAVIVCSSLCIAAAFWLIFAPKISLQLGSETQNASPLAGSAAPSFSEITESLAGEAAGNSKASNAAPERKRSISAIDQDEISDALARVQIIKRVHFDNGSIVELPIAHGTGFCVTPSGYFLTTRHVIDTYSDAVEQVTLTVNGKPHPAKRDATIVLFIHGSRYESKLIHASSRFDLAVVKTDGLQALPYFELSTKSDLKLLTEVFALGFPGVAAEATAAEEAGLSAKFEASYMRAIADKCTVNAESQLPASSFVHSTVPGSITKASRTETAQMFVYHSAPIFGGNSGGPLVDKKGLVLGINTAVRRDLGGKLNQAFLTSQFRDELNTILPEKLHWK